MEIVRLEVSTQQHLERMQETAKMNYVQYGKSTKAKKGKKPQSGAGASSAGAGDHRGSKPSGKGRVSISSGHLLQMWERQTPKSTGLQSCGLQHAEDVERDTMRRFASRGNAPHTL